MRPLLQNPLSHTASRCSLFFQSRQPHLATTIKHSLHTIELPISQILQERPFGQLQLSSVERHRFSYNADILLHAMIAHSDQIITGNAADAYQNCPLVRGSGNNIRVLEILPPSLNDCLDIIACHMRVVPLNSGIPYAAVSYVWGEPDVTKTILVDGIPMIVRVNIWNFLWQQRNEGYSGLVWIDAICIHQQDVSERSHQVGLMGQIYSKATEVHVWLGVEHGNEDITQALQLLSSFRGQSTSPGLQHPAQYPEDWTVSQWQTLKSLCNSEYWSRLWIVQEFILSQTLEIRCGQTTMGIGSLDEFESLLRRLMWSRSGVRESQLGYIENHTYDTVHPVLLNARSQAQEMIPKIYRATNMRGNSSTLTGTKDDLMYEMDSEPRESKINSFLVRTETILHVLESTRALQDQFLELRPKVQPRSILNTASLITQFDMVKIEDDKMVGLRHIIARQINNANRLNRLLFESRKPSLDKLPFVTLSERLEAQKEEFEALEAAAEQANVSNSVRLREILRDINDSMAMDLVRQRRKARLPGKTRGDADLVEIICEYSNADCSDPRDHVYALLALADSATSILPDYSKSSAEIFRDVFNLLKLIFDISRHKIRILEPLRIIGSALGLNAGDHAVKMVFDEMGAECFLNHDDDSEGSEP